MPRYRDQGMRTTRGSHEPTILVLRTRFRSPNAIISAAATTANQANARGPGFIDLTTGSYRGANARRSIACRDTGRSCVGRAGRGIIARFRGLAGFVDEQSVLSAGEFHAPCGGIVCDDCTLSALLDARPDSIASSTVRQSHPPAWCGRVLHHCRYRAPRGRDDWARTSLLRTRRNWIVRRRRRGNRGVRPRRGCGWTASRPLHRQMGASSSRPDRRRRARDCFGDCDCDRRPCALRSHTRGPDCRRRRNTAARSALRSTVVGADPRPNSSESRVLP